MGWSILAVPEPWQREPPNGISSGRVRRLRPGLAVRAVLLAVSGCAGLAMLHAAACIPDLPNDDEGADAADAVATTDAGPVEEGSPDVGVVPHCGDGIIQLDLMEQCDPGNDAGTAFCSTQCKMLCPDGGFLWAFNDHCYTLAGEATSIVEAGSLCLPGGHVVTFASDDEFNAVTTALGGPVDDGGYSFWVGMRAHVLGDNHYDPVLLGRYETRYEPGWSPECSGCYARASDDAGDFAHNDAGSAGDCVRSRASPSVALWDKYPCIAAPKLAVICEHEPEDLALGMAMGVYHFDLVATYPAKTYVYVPGPIAGANAVATCTSLGGTLVTLESRDEREQLWKALARTSATQVWTGLAATAGGWAWDEEAGADASSGTNPPEWAIGEPADGGTRRAYLELTNARPVDTTLAHSGFPQAPLPGVVCEIH
jgi:cysteine-rich repeat protein